MAIDPTPDQRAAPNLRAFAQELDALRSRLRGELCTQDLDHLRKLEGWGRICTSLGWASAWTAPNLLSALLLAQGRTTRWGMIAHHVLHRGYDRVPGVPPKRTAEGFASGARRLLDWNDCLDPEAWAFEHNRQHHYRLGEAADPDCVELNLDWLRDARWPQPVKLLVIASLAATWKWTYYAPNTWRQLRARDRLSGRKVPTRDELEPLSTMFTKPDFILRCLLTPALSHFVLFPALFWPLGPWAVFSAGCNSVLAEILTNVQGFIVITTNHAGDDLHNFEGPPHDRAEFYLRQVLGSANFRTGGDLNDFLHAFLNYQIEHHLFPDLPMRTYQRIQPEVREICGRHGIPYVQQSVWRRLSKTLDVMTGRASATRPPRTWSPTSPLENPA